MNAGFQETVDLGYERNEIIIVPVNPDNFSALRNEVLSNPKVISAEGTQNHIGYGNYRRPLKDKEKQLEVDVLDIGPGYAQTMGLRLAEGRFFDRERGEADRINGSIVVNRMFVNDFGWTDPVGRTVTLYDTTRLSVVGVVEDFYQNGVWEAIEPLMLRVIPGDRYNFLAIRAKAGDLAAVLDFVSDKWKSLATNMIYGGRFQNDLMQEGADINSSILKVNVFLAIVATLLSLIGMYNMVSLDTLKRTKEIGIRKIQGASVPVIMYLVSRKYLAILLIASVAGSAAGFYLSKGLMDSIWDYFVTIGAGVLLLASLLMVASTLATISIKVSRAAMQNPVESLRYE
ncbi:MAG: ABC transporter permease [Bacteroidales bacterium]|nr:ABC transporter permease [Bacteroidales bacterium]